MLDPALITILTTTLSYGLCGSIVATAVRLIHRRDPGPRYHQAAAVGFLVGAAFGAFFGIFRSMMV